jgi:hypothetical protein
MRAAGAIAIGPREVVQERTNLGGRQYVVDADTLDGRQRHARLPRIVGGLSDSNAALLLDLKESVRAVIHQSG